MLIPNQSISVRKHNLLLERGEGEPSPSVVCGWRGQGEVLMQIIARDGVLPGGSSPRAAPGGFGATIYSGGNSASCKNPVQAIGL